jgi:hypothetical protein
VTPNFPKNISLSIERNGHAPMHYSIAEYVEACSVSISEEELAKAIESNEIWVMIWNPNNSVGSHQVAAASYDQMMELAAAEVVRE